MPPAMCPPTVSPTAPRAPHHVVQPVKQAQQLQQAPVQGIHVVLWRRASCCSRLCKLVLPLQPDHLGRRVGVCAADVEAHTHKAAARQLPDSTLGVTEGHLQVTQQCQV